MDSQFKNSFLSLKLTGQRSALSAAEKKEHDLKTIQYLQSVLDKKEVTTFEDIGFCYWNISDNFAFLRDGHAEFENHKKFYAHIKKESAHYLYWAVNDATQRLTLEKDGYARFWWDIYREAVAKNTANTDYILEFYVHRAALYAHSTLPHKKENLEFASLNFEKLLEKVQGTTEYAFYKVAYLSLLSRMVPFDKVELKKLCENLLNGLSQPDTGEKYLCGEWKSFITLPSQRKQSERGINSAINAFIYSGDLEIAKELYRNALSLGLTPNHFIEKRLENQ